MLIQCTKKLLDQLKIKPESSPDEDPLFSWHANLLTINRRKAVVLVNDSNRYVIVLYGLLAKDFRKLDSLIIEAIQAAYRQEGITEEIIEHYILHSTKFTYTKTKNPTTVARMNKSIESVYPHLNLLDPQTVIQPELSMGASRFLVGQGKKVYIKPNQELYKDLNNWSGKFAIQLEAVQVKVTLKLENYDVWRRLVIPLHINFRQLHNILQRAFGWQNSHLHQFYIYDNQDSIKKENESNINPSYLYHEGKSPTLNIVSTEETFSYSGKIPMKLDSEVDLSDFLPAHKTIKYIYDFGDDWEHDIEIESFIESYDKNHPICLDGEGNTPPEDVGGKYGYEEFRKVIADENNPDHEHIINWGEAQGYKPFDIKLVNFYLENRF